ncbi:MAG: TlpA disulfide reductase family protein [Cognaticolwellia sp.]
MANEQKKFTSIELLNQQLEKEKGKVVYIDFWSSWCIPCRKSFPWMNDLQAKYQAQGLTILSINLDHSRQLADEFLVENPANFPVIYDPKGLIARKYQLKGMPSSYIINRQGKIVSAHVGFNQEKKLAYEQELKALLTATIHQP